MTRDAAARMRRPLHARDSEADVLRYGREVIAVEARALDELVGRLDRSFLRRRRADSRTARQPHRHRHRQGRADRSEAHRHVRLDRRPGPFPPPGRGVSRRSGPRARRRRRAGPVAERRDGRGVATAARFTLTRSEADRHDRVGREHARPGGGDRACRWGGWTKRARWAWRPAPAPPSCWPWATRSRWSSAGYAASAAEDFARFHPGGALGRKLSAVDDHMRPLDRMPRGAANQTVRQVVLSSTRPGRRSGAIMLVDDAGRLAGLFTDSDLARLIERRNDAALDQPIHAVMAKSPTTVPVGRPHDGGHRNPDRTKIQRTAGRRPAREARRHDRRHRRGGHVAPANHGSSSTRLLRRTVRTVRTARRAPVRRRRATDEPEFVWPFAEMPETD